MEKYERLEKSANGISAFAITMTIIMWLAAIFIFLLYRVSLMNCIWLFVGGLFISLVGEAASNTMSALAEHMKDDYVTRKCMEKLIARLERPKNQ